MTNGLRRISIRLNIWFALVLTTCFLCAATAQAVQVNYSVEFHGVEDKDILERLNDISQLVQLRETPPSTLAALRQRGEGDVPALTQAMRSFAHYNARVTIDYAPQSDSLVRVLVWIHAGPAYPLEEFRIIPVEAEEGFPCPPGQTSSYSFFENLRLRDIGVALGTPATAFSILHGQECLENRLLDAGYALAHVEHRDVLVDQETQTVRVLLRVVSGPRLKFGSTRIRGLRTVVPSYVMNRVAWGKGQWFDPRKLEKTREALEQSGLFNTIRVETLPEVTPDCQVNMLIETSEAPHRTIGAGLDFSTSQGPGFSVEWERRNIRGIGESFSTLADVNTTFQSWKIVYARPDFLQRNQTMTWLGELRHESNDTYSQKSMEASVFLNREISEFFNYSYGAQTKYLWGVEYKPVNSDPANGVESSPTLLKFPCHFRYSTTDNLLDPICGQTWLLDIIPTIDLSDAHSIYGITKLTVSGYRPFWEGCAVSVAGRLTIGSVIGGSTLSITPPDLFLLGSDTLLRGFHYKTVGWLDETDEREPLYFGGRSMLAAQGEIRYRATPNLGWVGFLEVGQVFKNTIPDFEHSPRVSIGLGARYHTPVGPLRLDLAFPLNRRTVLNDLKEEVYLDEPFQYYISIGQAF